MLDLKIEPTQQPGDNLVIGSKISRRIQLVDGPFFTDPMRLFIRNGKLSALYHVRKLEYHADRQTANKRDDGKSNQGGQPTDHDDRQNNVKCYVHHFGDPKNKMFLQLQFPGLRVDGNLSANVFYKIVIKDPGDIRNTVQEDPIHMLKPVKPIPRLTFVESHKGFHINIRIHPFDIGIGMVVDIVFYLPKVRVASQYIERIGRSFI